MLPVYTRYLSPADYGVLQMLEMAVDVAAILFTAGVTSGAQKFYFAADSDAERNGVMSTAFMLDLLVSLIASAALAGASTWIARLLLRDEGSALMVMVAAANFTLNMLSGLPLLLMRIRQQAGLGVITSLAKLVLQLSLNIAFVVWLKLGPLGILLSTFCANLIVGGLLTAWFFRHVGLRLSRRIASALVRFGIPYQASFAGSFIITFGDRFFLERGHGLGAVGLYALAYQFGFLLSQVSAEPFLRAWEPQMFQIATLPVAERDAQYNRSFFLFSILLLSGAVGLALGTPVLLRLMTTAAFLPAANVVPVILLAYVLQSWMFVLKFGIDFAGRPGRFTVATWLSVFVTVAAYALLIPPYGMFGAAWATAIGFAVRLLASFVLAQRLWPIQYRFGRVGLLSLYAAAVVTGCQFVPSDSLVRELAIAMAGTTLFALLVWRGVLTRDESALLANVARNPKSAIKLLTSAA
jgi:O-antigen/teichoic acid export membrane protein